MGLARTKLSRTELARTALEDGAVADGLAADDALTDGGIGVLSRREYGARTDNIGKGEGIGEGMTICRT